MRRTYASSLSRRRLTSFLGKGGEREGGWAPAISLLLISTGDLGQRNRKFLMPTPPCLWAWQARREETGGRWDSSSGGEPLRFFASRVSVARPRTRKLHRAFPANFRDSISPCTPYHHDTAPPSSPPPPSPGKVRVVPRNQITFA